MESVIFFSKTKKFKKNLFCIRVATKFSKFFPSFPNFFQILTRTHFLFYFCFKLSLMWEFLLNSIKTLKRYFKFTINVLKKKLVMNESLICMLDYLGLIEFSLQNIIKFPGLLFKIQCFSSLFQNFSNSKFFQVLYA